MRPGESPGFLCCLGLWGAPARRPQIRQRGGDPITGVTADAVGPTALWEFFPRCPFRFSPVCPVCPPLSTRVCQSPPRPRAAVAAVPPLLAVTAAVRGPFGNPNEGMEGCPGANLHPIFCSASLVQSDVCALALPRRAQCLGRRAWPDTSPPDLGESPAVVVSP